MSVSRLAARTLHPAEHLLAWAFGISVVTHLLTFGAFELGKHYGWWKKDLLPAWFAKSTQTTLAELKKKQQAKPPLTERQQEPPLLFVEVDPSVATQEAPKKATHYSSHNSKAANPDVRIDSQIPNINGTQKHVPKTQDVAKSQPMPLRPSPPKTTPGNDEVEAKPKPKGGPVVGDLAIAKPYSKPSEGQAETDAGEAKAATHSRPRSLAEAKLRQQLAMMPGQKMKQEGGVQRHLSISTLDAISTPFGEYDRELIDAIQSHWNQLLERMQFAEDRTGTVVIQFTLSHTGRILDLQVQHSTVDEVLKYACERAIEEPAPFREWPPDMRRLIGADTREITFTFYYE